jgi:hypothetical protein
VGAVVAVVALLAGIRSASACGCGALFRATEVSEKALVSLHAGHETIVPGLTIHRSGDHAAVVFPVPARPRIHALPAHLNLFSRLEEATTPPETGGGGSSSGSPVAGAPAPTVVSTKIVGGYVVSILRGGTRQTVLGWLFSHGYTLPAGAGPILGTYVSKDWYFVAIRYSKHVSGEIKPLAISFPASKIVYPMKLSRVATAPVDLELFLSSDTPLAVSGATGLHKTFSAALSSVSSSLSHRVRALLPGTWLTRVDIDGGSPHKITSDISAVPKT